MTDFFVGHYGGFDRMAAQAVKEAKESHSEVCLWLVLPYHPAIRPIKTPEGFDGTYYPWEDECIPERLAIVRANRRMVDVCGYLIAYAVYSGGNAGRVLEYANRREAKGRLSVKNLAAE